MRERLVAARKARNLSVSDIAELLGISTSFYYKIEAGTRNPSLQLAKQIAAMFNTTIDELFGNEEYSEGRTATNWHSRLRPVVAQAWQRCLAYKVDPKNPMYESLDAEGLACHQIVHRMLVKIVIPWMEYISAVMADWSHLVALSDPEGWILQILGDIEGFGGKSHGVGRGINWSEGLIGNNAIGTALATSQPVSIIGEEHFVHRYRSCAGFGIPLQNRGQLHGALAVIVRNGDAVEPRKLLTSITPSIEANLASLADLEQNCVCEKMQALGRHIVSTVSEIKSPLLRMQANCERRLKAALKTKANDGTQLQAFCRLVNRTVQALDSYLQTAVAWLPAAKRRREWDLVGIVRDIKLLRNWQSELANTAKHCYIDTEQKDFPMLQTAFHCVSGFYNLLRRLVESYHNS